MKFEDITNIEDMLNALNKPFLRTGSSKKEDVFICHYTTFSRIRDIHQTDSLYLSKASSMNDQHENNFGYEDVWRRTFFSCFVRGIDENMAMWEMYGGRHDASVRIAISMEKVESWLADPHIFVTKDKVLSTNELTGFEIGVTGVAYTNILNSPSPDKPYTTFGGTGNSKFDLRKFRRELTGYVKSNAWAYEHEIRIRALSEEPTDETNIALKLPDDFWESVHIMAGPCYEGNIAIDLHNEFGYGLTDVTNSMFTGFYLPKSSCDGCEYKEQVELAEGIDASISQNIQSQRGHVFQQEAEEKQAIFELICMEPWITTRQVAERCDITIDRTMEYITKLFMVDSLILPCDLSDIPTEADCKWMKKR